VKRGARIAAGAALIVAMVVVGMVLAFPLKTKAIKVDLPPPAEATPALPTKPVFIVLDADGALTIDGQETTLETLPHDLSTRFAGVPKAEQQVMIQAPDKTSHERIMGVLKGVKANGWFKLGLVNDDAQTPKP